MRVRWLSTWGALLVLAGASCATFCAIFCATSCATGSGLTGVGGAGAAGGSGPSGSTTHASSASGSASAGPSGSGGSTGSGGASGSSSASSGGPTTTSTSSTSSSSGGCPDTPCKLTSPQCGCAPGQQCTISSFARACQLAGATGLGQGCAGANSCAPGLLCVGGGATGVCDLFCATDADCSVTGGICALGLNDGMGGSIPNATLCSASCDPTTSAGCAVGGTGCQIGREQAGQMRWLTYCASAGTKTKGQACNPMLSECAPTFGCFKTSPTTDTCLEYCHVSSPACPAAQTCYALQDTSMLPIFIGGQQIGVCQ